jgi:hypothetical protein
MSKIRILRQARELIESGEENFVCLAIEYAAKRLERISAGAELVAWVESMLGDSGTLSGWIRSNRPELWFSATCDERIRLLRVTRLAWIDWMISELEKP